MNNADGFSHFVKLLPDLLETQTTVSFFPKGSSMLPTIREGDKVFVTKAQRLRKYDITLFVLENGKPILHRLVKINKGGTYTFQGDTQGVKEENITPEMVVAKVDHIQRNGKNIKMHGFWFYIKSFIVLHLKYIKRALS